MRAWIEHRQSVNDSFRSPRTAVATPRALGEWPSDRELAPEKVLRLTGWLIHLCEIVLVRKYFLRRMLNNLRLRLVLAWRAKFHVAHTSAALSPRTHLGLEFHANVSVWGLLVASGLGSPAGCFSAPVCRCCCCCWRRRWRRLRFRGQVGRPCGIGTSDPGWSCGQCFGAVYRKPQKVHTLINTLVVRG